MSTAESASRGRSAEELTDVEQVALLSGRNTWQSREVSRLGVRSLFFADGPHGVRKQLGSADHLGLNSSQPATCFPTAATLANSWDRALLSRIGEALGREAAAQQVDVLLGPALNIKRDPRCGRNFEYFSEDPLLAGELAAAYVRGVQSTGVAASPKHFAVNSQELRRMASDSVIDERTMRELYLAAFEIVVRDAKPRTLMSAYNRVNGTYAHENRHLLTEILREEWGFEGLVVSDWGGGNDPVAALEAGGTLEMPSPGLDSVRTLVEALAEGRLSHEVVRARAQEVLDLVVDADRGPSPQPVDLDAHHALAREAARRSIVLLRNEENLLPLTTGTQVAMIGDLAFQPRYQGAGSSLVNPTRLSSPLEAMRGSDLDVVAEARGYRRDGGRDPKLLAEAVDAAHEAEVVLLHLGLDESSESEGLDREDLRLPANQIEVLEAVAAVNPEVVVVLSAGSPVEMPWLEKTRALLHGYLGGQAGAEAMADVLAGVAEPTGRLAESYPLHLSDLPTALTYPADGPRAEYREGPFVGYRYLDTAEIPVRFPFGFGLGYSRIVLADLRIDEDGARVRATNSSARDGVEVVQMYVSRPGSALIRPIQELKGFQRVELAAGESTDVLLPFDPGTFRHFDPESGTWQIERGVVEIRVGTHSRDLALVGTLETDGVRPVAVPEGAADPLAPYRRADVHAVPDAAFTALLGAALPAPGPVSTGEPGRGSHVPRRVRRELDVNDPLRAMAEARNPLARAVAAVMDALVRRGARAGTPSLNLLFTYNMPFRAIAKMTGGAVSTPMVEALMEVVNGRPLQGSRDLAAALLRSRRAGGRIAAELAASAGARTARAGTTTPPRPSSAGARDTRTSRSTQNEEKR